jgi:choline dehydrogenase-like flavoprotein
MRATRALQEIGVQETFPGAAVQTDEQIENFIRSTLATENHHGGTAAMIPRHLGGVVDSGLKVYGVQGLRVIDASIMPTLPAAHLQATVYGIAEKVSFLPEFTLSSSSPFNLRGKTS